MIDLRDERKVRDGGLPADEPLLLCEHAVEDTHDTYHLFLVAFDCARQPLRVPLREPEGLPVVRTLSGNLERHPLQLVVLVRVDGGGNLVLGVVLIHEVRQDRGGLPARVCQC